MLTHIFICLLNVFDVYLKYMGTSLELIRNTRLKNNISLNFNLKRLIVPCLKGIAYSQFSRPDFTAFQKKELHMHF